PDAQRHGAHRWQELGDHAEPAREGGLPHGRLRAPEGALSAHLAVALPRAVPGAARAVTVTVSQLTAVPVRPASAVPVLALATGVPAGQVLAGRLALQDLHRDQGQLAPVVDLADLDLDLVADVDDVVDVLDAPAAVQLADLGDVEQAVLARQ